MSFECHMDAFNLNILVQWSWKLYCKWILLDLNRDINEHCMLLVKLEEIWTADRYHVQHRIYMYDVSIYIFGSMSLGVLYNLSDPT